MFIPPLGGGIDLSCSSVETHALTLGYTKMARVLVLGFCHHLNKCVYSTFKIHITHIKQHFSAAWWVLFVGRHLFKAASCWAALHSDIPSSITFSGTLTRLLSIFYGYVCLGRRTPRFCPCGDWTL